MADFSSTVPSVLVITTQLGTARGYCRKSSPESLPTVMGLQCLSIGLTNDNVAAEKKNVP